MDAEDGPCGPENGKSEGSDEAKSTVIHAAGNHDEASAASNTGSTGPSSPHDSESDVSMAADSDDGNEEAGHSDLLQPVRSTDVISKKRKPSADETPESPSHDSLGTGQAKKVKLDREQEGGSSHADKSLLPAELWHHIFTFCPPKTLGNLLRVNKLFHCYLHPSSGIPRVSPSPLPRTAASVLKPNAIWQASRRLFWPHMPTPLQNRTELEMWQLSCSSSCQQCGKTESRTPAHGIDLLRLGPGEDGVAAVWPFGVRLCGPCLKTRSKKVGRLQASGTVSRSGLILF